MAANWAPANSFRPPRPILLNRELVPVGIFKKKSEVSSDKGLMKLERALGLEFVGGGRKFELGPFGVEIRNHRFEALLLDWQLSATQ